MSIPRLERNKMEDWLIIYGKKDGVEGYALRQLNGMVQKFIPYVVRIVQGKSVSDEILRHNLMVIGTKYSNSLISEFDRRGVIRIDTLRKESINVRVTGNPFEPNLQLIVIAGADENGVLYATREFEHYIVDRATKVDSAGIHYRLPFLNRFDENNLQGSPAIEYRGLWTWGHVIYDYRRYLDHMSKWKMNIIVIWNDFAPINAGEIVSYAHERGISVIMGYSWSWGESVDPNSGEDLEKWSKMIIEKYEREYRNTGCDGIYFQLGFTETNITEIGGKSTAALATEWVNTIARKLLDTNPKLRIMFGLHATSIKEGYEALKGVDERIEIIWEDIGLPIPQFPYSYDPSMISNYETAIDYTSKVSRLRMREENFGIIAKGMTNLDWKNFEHQPDSFILGEYEPEFVSRRAMEKMPRWKHVEMEWRKNLKCFTEITKAIIESKPARMTILGLLEDGLWEEKMWLPVGLFAETMWNPYLPPNDVVQKVAATDDTHKLV